MPPVSPSARGRAHDGSGVPGVAPDPIRGHRGDPVRSRAPMPAGSRQAAGLTMLPDTLDGGRAVACHLRSPSPPGARPFDPS